MRVFSRSRRVKESCDLGCTHDVTYYEVADLTEVMRIKKMTYYGPTPTGIGYDTFYRDYFGNLYLSQATWDGAGGITDAEDNYWMRSPIGEVKKTMDGTLIDYNGRPI